MEGRLNRRTSKLTSSAYRDVCRLRLLTDAWPSVVVVVETASGAVLCNVCGCGSLGPELCSIVSR